MRTVEGGGLNQRMFVSEGCCCEEIGKVPGEDSPARQEIRPLFELQRPVEISQPLMSLLVF